MASSLLLLLDDIAAAFADWAADDDALFVVLHGEVLARA